MWPFKKKERETSEAPELHNLLTWRDQELQNALLYGSLFQVCSQLTQVWFTTTESKPRRPEEVAEVYVEMYKPLETWFKGGELKAQIKEMLETLYPEPPGYEPGETLLPREDIIPGVKTVKYVPRESRE
jgi:hypothetical protein